MIKGNFLVPDYFPGFSCKGKECRHCCCQGWVISLTEKEYFQMQSLDVPAKEKEKIEAYVGIRNHPSREVYARINLTVTGVCPFRRKEDGYCSLQVLCGEEKIPSVCRYYPRAIRVTPILECSISNSCEWVIEALIHSQEKLSFRHQKLSFSIDAEEENLGASQDIHLRRHCMSILEDRRYPLSFRIERIAKYLHVSPLGNEEIPFYLEELKKATSHSYSLAKEVEKVNPDSDFLLNERKLEKKVPYFDIRAEKIFVNHLLYVSFPYVREEEDFSLACLSLKVIYAFYMEVILGNMKRYQREHFVDLTSSFFRLVEHSDIYYLIEQIHRKKLDS